MELSWTVSSSREMYDAVLRRLEPGTIFIGAAAVADFRPVRRADQKIKKNGQSRLTIELASRQRISSAPLPRQRPTRLASSSALPLSLSQLSGMLKRRREKSLDLIVANDITFPVPGLIPRPMPRRSSVVMVIGSSFRFRRSGRWPIVSSTR
jgi:phosphopantothenoylcysteine decarboxylase/phosphopantothenate--cysteine ligase